MPAPSASRNIDIFFWNFSSDKSVENYDENQVFLKVWM